MRVTKFNYPLEDNYIKLLDKFCERVTTNKGKRDVVLLIEGAEGEGKSTYSVAIAYYVAEQTKREFSSKNVFFDLEDLINFAKSTEKQIIIWDEPALSSLSNDHANGINKNLIRLLMMARKKRHFFIINITRFWKFPEYVVADRGLGLTKVYSRNQTESGRFMHIKKKFLEALYYDYKIKKQKNYNKYRSNYIRGTFPDVLNPDYKYNVLSEFDIDDYERRKDDAISKIGAEKPKEESEKVLKLKYFIANLEGMTGKEKARRLGISEPTITEWKKIVLPPPVPEIRY